MALATQCPHCHTTFKVAHDQLKLRAGLVRCGACKQIFNGIENLVAPDQAGAPYQKKYPRQQSTAAASPPVSPSASSTGPAHMAPTAAASTEPPAPLMAPEGGQSAINALEFMPVDDPETRTRILAPEPESMPSSAADQQPAPSEDEADEDPLTRMTLVNFSLFDEDLAQTDSPRSAGESVPSRQENRETRPATGEWQAGPTETDETAFPSDSAGMEAAVAPAAAEPQDDAAAPAAENALDAFPEDRQTSAGTDAESQALTDSGADAAASIPLDSASMHGDSSATIVSTFDDLEQEYEAASGQMHHEPEAESTAATDEDTEEPAFVTSERRRQRRRRALRIFMAIASVLLFAAALLQGAYAFRDQLAARFPQTRPLLSQLCDLAGCQVLLPAQIEQVSIESNELQAQSANGNAFALSLLLHNRSAVAQAWPHIELTLNDKDGNALVRRVLSPREYLPADKALAEGIAARSEQPVKVRFELNQMQASDYRVYLFYP